VLLPYPVGDKWPLGPRQWRHQAAAALSGEGSTEAGSPVAVLRLRAQCSMCQYVSRGCAMIRRAGVVGATGEFAVGAS
jgi:hypothetical protein